MAFTLPPLPYAPDTLEPYIDKMTMEIHHGKHHQAYVTNLNKALESAPDLANKTLPELLANNCAIVPENIRTAVGQARVYDAATSVFPGLFASRRNYDVAQGANARGQWRSGVLEQSWRVGGATGAEIAALEAFRADPGLQVVHTSTVEVYGES